ncbi:MAG: leucine-rich repeat domain-containing protein [Prevotella sp.]|nr:leucine-rich repeat domain-containing protein [Prevotella sp.]
MMLKRLMFMLFALLLTVSSALAQAIAPRCRVCGRKLTECPYKGNHAKKQSEGKKPAEKKKPKKKAPKKKPSHEAEPVKPSAATTPSAQPSTATPTDGYRVMADGTVDVYNSKGVIKYLNEKTPATSLKLTGNFGYNGLKALRNHSFKTLDLTDVHVSDSYEETNAKDHIDCIGNKFHLQWVDGINADTLILPNETERLETAVLGYTIKNLYIGKNVKAINFIEADIIDYNLPKDLHESMLENIFVDKENKDFKSIDGVLYKADGSELIMFPSGRGFRDDFYIPEQVKQVRKQVKKIADYAFFNSKNDQYIRIYNNVQEIGYYAFAYSKIEHFTLGHGVQIINDGAFFHCDNLEFFEFNYELKKIPADVFEYCPKLAVVDFPEGMPSGKLPDDIFRFSRLLNGISIGYSTNWGKFKSFHSELANYLRNTRYNCQYPLHIVLYSNQDVKRYKKVFNDKRKFNIHKSD